MKFNNFLFNNIFYFFALKYYKFCQIYKSFPIKLNIFDIMLEQYN